MTSPTLYLMTNDQVPEVASMSMIPQLTAAGVGIA